MKYYFEKSAILADDETSAYTKDHFIEKMKKERLTEIEVFPAIMIKGEDLAWCSIYQEPMVTKEGDCGKICHDYKPRNGKNGRCRFSKNCYEPADKSITIYKKKLTDFQLVDKDISHLKHLDNKIKKHLDKKSK